RRPGETDPGPLLDVWTPVDRARSWAVALVIALVAVLVRLWELGRITDEGTPVFDEKHYVPQAWQMLRNGGFEDNPGYELVAHPPVAKQLIAAAGWLVGYGPWGWRVVAAVSATLMVLLSGRIGRLRTGSTMVRSAA